MRSCSATIPGCSPPRGYRRSREASHHQPLGERPLREEVADPGQHDQIPGVAQGGPEREPAENESSAEMDTVVQRKGVRDRLEPTRQLRDGKKGSREQEQG